MNEEKQNTTLLLPINIESDNSPLKLEVSMQPAISVYQQNRPDPSCKQRQRRIDKIRLKRNKDTVPTHTCAGQTEEKLKWRKLV